MTFQGVSFHGLAWSAQPSFDIILKGTSKNMLIHRINGHEKAATPCVTKKVHSV
jgi:hypothetical protein